MPKIKFRHGSSAKYNTDFKKDQVWVASPGPGKLRFVDETAKIANDVATESLTELPDDERCQDTSVVTRSPATNSSNLTNSDGSSHWQYDDYPRTALIHGPSLPMAVEFGTRDLSNDQASRNLYDSGRFGTDQAQAETSHEYPDDMQDFPDLMEGENIDCLALIGSTLTEKSYKVTDSDATILFSLQEACLMRYWIDNLACWFDLCDDLRRFAILVPQRAKRCAPLLQAILTCSARHLTSIQRYRVNGSIKYQGKLLPNLTTQTALYYHNHCINQIVASSNDPHKEWGGDLLTAAVILRLDEFIDVAHVGEDQETFLLGSQVFLHTLAQEALDESSLCHAVFWVAVRQEILGVFVKQREFRLPLDQCSAYRSNTPANDCVWANRLVLLCADVLKHCYGVDSQTSRAYDELVVRERMYRECLPGSFDPLYYQQPDNTRGEVLPEIWYVADCHFTGIQHLELAHLLLAVFNPRTALVGLGAVAARNKVEEEVKMIVLKLCGIAISNSHTPPGLITAFAAIAMCGERFADPTQQRALMDVLVRTEREHAGPTLATQVYLKKAWGWSE